MKIKAVVVGLLLCALMVSGAMCQSGTTVQYTVTVMSGQGSVSPSGGSAALGSAVTFTAVPASGWTFDYWGGDASGSQNPLYLTMDAPKNIQAYFTQSGGGSGGGSTGSLQKPKIGYVPPNWYLSTDDPYSSYLGYGMIEYTDSVDEDFVQIYWGDVPASLIGQESNANALISQATYEAIFAPDDTGSMFVAGQLAGYAEAYESYYDVWETEVVFVKGSTYVDIFAAYDATSDDIQDAIDFIEGIYF